MSHLSAFCLLHGLLGEVGGQAMHALPICITRGLLPAAVPRAVPTAWASPAAGYPTGSNGGNLGCVASPNPTPISPRPCRQDLVRGTPPSDGLLTTQGGAAVSAGAGRLRDGGSLHPPGSPSPCCTWGGCTCLTCP